MVATFGGLSAKQTFRFIVASCPGYVTGQFLARLKDSGASFPSRSRLNSLHVADPGGLRHAIER
jgi:hypothetical protein